MKIKDLPTLEKPREKAIRFGLASLTNAELIALLISHGTKGLSAIDIARNLLHDYHGLYSLANTPFQSLMSTKGLKSAKALKLAAAFTLINRYEKSIYDDSLSLDSYKIYKKYESELSRLESEVFVLLMFDVKGRIIKEITLYKGNEEMFHISYKEILMELLLNRTSHFVIVHNHPSGDPSPSNFDIITTVNLKKEADAVSVSFYDHIIISNYKFFSFREDSFNDLVS